MELDVGEERLVGIEKVGSLDFWRWGSFFGKEIFKED